jgi:hypothetical protein
MDVSSVLEKKDGAWVKRLSLSYGNRFASRAREVYYKSTSVAFSENADDLLAMSLMPAMMRGENLHVHGRVSERLLSNLPQLQDILIAFGPGLAHTLTRVEVSATDVTSTPAASGKVASFFSGGLDSFTTLMQHRDEIDALIFVHGFDIDVRNLELRGKISRRMNAIAAELGLPLIEIETDLRAFANRSMHWELYFGPALACIALSLQAEFSKVFISSAYGIQSLLPSGSHPLIDPLWSTERLDVVHAGLEMNRVEKAMYAADFDIVRRNLRVCYANTRGEYNCGSCRKCILMQTTLAAIGVLEKFPVFEAPLTLDGVRTIKASNGEYLDRIEMLIDIARAGGADPEFVEALRQPLVNYVKALREPPERPRIDGDLFGRLFPPVTIKDNT